MADGKTMQDQEHTDEALTRLCMEAMWEHREGAPPGQFSREEECLTATWWLRDGQWSCGRCSMYFDPLRNDEHAMALAKRFAVSMHIEGAQWQVKARGGRYGKWSDDLNRAIVECVAKMQRAKAEVLVRVPDNVEAK